MRLLIILLSPLVSLMIALSKLLASAFGSSGLVNVLTEEEIVTMIETSEKEGAIENEEKEMIVSVLEFGDLLVREVMIPRINIVALDVDTPLDKALQTLINSGHSRIPIYEDTIDNIKGLLYAKDLLNLWGKTPRPLKDIMRKANFVPESKPADVLLHELKRDRIHMVILSNEYGGPDIEMTTDHIVIEHGTQPADDIFHACRSNSRNDGVIDQNALLRGDAQDLRLNPGGTFMLFRVGDAMASRNVHAAVYDSLRLCKDP